MYISAVARSDFHAWVHLFRAYCDFYEVPHTVSLEDSAFSLFFTDRHPNRLHGLLARDDEGMLLGFAHFRTAPSSLDANETFTTFLDDLFTAPFARGKGVGRALIASVVDWGRASGAGCVQWTTAVGNLTAQALYDKVALRTHWFPFRISFPCATLAVHASDSVSTELGLRPGHHKQWQELFHAYSVFYECPVRASVSEKVLRWLLDPSHPQKAITAISADGELIGFLHYRSRPRSLSGSHVGYIDDLFVSDGARGSGAADALLQRFFQLCIGHGWPLAHWITAETNRTAQQVYKRNGAFHSPFLLYEIAL